MRRMPEPLSCSASRAGDRQMSTSAPLPSLPTLVLPLSLTPPFSFSQVEAMAAAAETTLKWAQEDYVREEMACQ